MPIYDLTTKFRDSASFSASAMVSVYRHKHPSTFNRATQKSLSEDVKLASAIRDRIDIIDDIRTVQVTSNKRSHLTTMGASLLPTCDWENQLLPGDYVFVWMAQDKETIQAVKSKLTKGEPACRWDDGLKFFGRVSVCRKKRVTSPDGLKTVSYSLTAAGFTELDGSLYYEPYMATNYQGALSSWLHTFGIEVNKLIESSRKSANGGIETHTIVPELFNALYSAKVPADLGLDVPVNLTSGLDSRTSFVIPPSVAAVFGVGTGSTATRWSDVMELVVGVQKWTDNIWTPDGVKKGQKHHYTGIPLMGTFVPQVAAFTGQKTAWSLIEGFVNRAVNEMFVSLRRNADGLVVPTLTIRQLPYSTDWMGDSFTPTDPLSKEQRDLADEANAEFEKVGGRETRAGKRILKKYETRYANSEFNPATAIARPTSQMYGVTRFTELPRWVLPDILIKEVDIGRSDAGRINFVHVYGEAGQQESTTKQFARMQPVRDDLDIARSGLRPLTTTVSCSPKDVKLGGPEAWMNLLADIQIGAHLALSGVVNLHGLVDPIACGDNIQFDGIIAHLEAVNHVFSVNIAGTPSFLTSLEFSQGINARRSGNPPDLSTDWFGIGSAANAVNDPATMSDHNDPATILEIET